MRKPLVKKLPDIVRQVQASHPETPVEVWAFDEHRVGLRSIRRRVWARRGSNPLAPVHDR